MIKVIVIENFHLEKFDELKNIKRANIGRNTVGFLYVNDTFECDEEMADYLMGKNATKRAFVKVVEVIPEIKHNFKTENTEKKTITRRRKRSVAKD